MSDNILGEKQIISGISYAYDLAIDNLSPAVVTKLHTPHTPCGQRWIITESPSAQGSYILQNQYDNKYLAVSDDQQSLVTLPTQQSWDIVQVGDPNQGRYK
ncbi:hypothetical protein H0H81_000503 [Sphagnurus paluster]|uniref:Uncharacterized protein n=1 Tax=Sphagnurus paluster TaxID=117069 RepID=A0A9P7K1X4_9AGAR|nr:hypothetical protein H0H81_000503 [Sphagnurus paluster]